MVIVAVLALLAVCAIAGFAYAQNRLGGESTATAAAATKPHEQGQVAGAPASSKSIVTVPDIQGLTVKAAKARLKQIGLKIDEVRLIQAHKPRGIVIGEAPGSGETIHLDQPVTLYASSGFPLRIIPQVDGWKLSSAMTKIHAVGLGARTEQEFSDSVLAGHVIRIAPSAGSKRRADAPVLLTVSKGGKPFVLESYGGESRAQATSGLHDAGLKAKVTLVESTTVPGGQVVNQSPAAGSSVRKGDTVILDVARGFVIMPRVAGLKRGQATSELAHQGLTMTTTASHSSTPSGQIISQSPAPGTRLQKGDHVQMVVSSGPAPSQMQAQAVTVPDVTGISEAAARSQLEADGFAVTVNYEQVGDRSQVGKVVDQSPAGATGALSGDPVTIYVGQ